LSCPTNVGLRTHLLLLHIALCPHYLRSTTLFERWQKAGSRGATGQSFGCATPFLYRKMPRRECGAAGHGQSP
jgi:hypothetical protein